MSAQRKYSCAFILRGPRVSAWVSLPAYSRGGAEIAESSPPVATDDGRPVLPFVFFVANSLFQSFVENRVLSKSPDWGELLC